jgi:hypothetical protein
MTMSHEALRKRAEELGLPTDSGVYKSNNETVNQLAITDYELHRRIREEERHRREHRLWIIAVLAAAFAFLSALAGLGTGIVQRRGSC